MLGSMEEKLCSLEGCERKVGRVRGWCTAHYRRWQRYGDPLHKTYTRGESNVGKTCSECSSPAHKKGLCQKHYMAQPEQRQRKAAWYAANREKSISNALLWQKNNPESRAATHVKRKTQMELSEEDRDFSVEYRKAIAHDPCYYCSDHEAEAYHIDHYISLYNEGTDHWWNLVRACSTCNHRKNSKNGDEFLNVTEQILQFDGPPDNDY